MEELNNVDLSDIDFSVEAEDWIDVTALREMYHPFNSQVRDDHELTSIQRSIQKNGFTGMMIVVNRWNGKIVSGHGKVEACFKAGYRGKLPVVWREYKGEIEHRNAMLQFNMASGHQDPEKQRREIEALLAVLPAEEVTSDLAITPDELQRILGLAVEVGSEGEETSPGSDTEPEIDKAEELRKKWNVETGQLWQLGKHRLICGDCTDRAVVDRVMGGEKAQLLVTSPPYGVGKEYESGGVDEWRRTIKGCFAVASNYASAWFVNLANRRTGNDGYEVNTFGLMVSDFEDLGFRLITTRIWAKDPAWAGQAPYWSHTYKSIDDFEFLGTFAKDKPKYQKRLTDDEYKEWGWRGVWEVASVRSNKIHSAMFPLEIPERAIKLLSDRSELLYEPFAGSGTTLIACENLNRQCRAVEISPAYCAVILERFFAHTGVEPRIVA